METLICRSCVFKLAKRLANNHKIDWIDALIRAQKGIERAEHRLNNKKDKSIKRFIKNIFNKIKIKRKIIRTVTEKERELLKQTLNINPDYSQPCQPETSSSFDCPAAGITCEVDTDCAELTDEACDCPAPLPNSSYVSDDCVITITSPCQDCVPDFIATCKNTGTGYCTGNCYYDCDAGYVWDPDLEECVVAVIYVSTSLTIIALIKILISDTTRFIFNLLNKREHFIEKEEKRQRSY